MVVGRHVTNSESQNHCSCFAIPCLLLVPILLQRELGLGGILPYSALDSEGPLRFRSAPSAPRGRRPEQASESCAVPTFSA